MAFLLPARGRTAAAGALLVLLAVSACGGSSAGGGQTSAPTPQTTSAQATSAQPTSAAPAAAQATVYGSATPPNAPTQQMTLYHVDVPPGAVIAPHQHPGQQISHITAGTLTYTVLAGTVTVIDAPVDGKPGLSREVAAPATISVTAGQTLTEPAGEIHQATNAGTEVVRIDIAILVPLGDPLSVPAG